jgi:calcium-dependent protein kinase
MVIPERDVARIVWQVLRALAYLHKNGLTHRDLKPENLAFESRKHGNVRLIDFGFALDLNDQKLNISNGLIVMGTPYYMAPEVVNKEQLIPKSDLWSLGVAMFAMLVGYPPFIKAKTEENLFELINTNNYDYNEQDWGKISYEARRMIDALMQPNVDRRLSADQALKHLWL